MAGDNLDDSIVRYMRKNHNMLIGEKSAEQLKINVGTAFERTSKVEMEIKGRNLITGLPMVIKVTSDEMYDALLDSVTSIVDAVRSVLEKTPPELASDIYERGIVMTGGGSLLYGLDMLIKDRTGINVVIADDAVSCVAIGTGKFIEYITSKKQRR